MLKDLKGITNRLVKYYDPEKIILFGSYGKRDASEGSDIDLFIIKDTNKRPIDRRIEVEKMLSNRNMPLDIVVYTPSEVRLLYYRGSPFIEEVMERGRLLYMRKTTEAWIKDAKEELESAKILYDYKKYRGVCYHSQQCVEKGLKALILEKGKKPGRIHDIVELLNKTEKLGYRIGLPIDDAVFLNSIYKGRYPTEEGLLPQGEPTKVDAERAIATAKTLFRKLQDLKGS